MGFVLLVLGLIALVPLSSFLKENNNIIPLFWKTFGVMCFLYPAVPQLSVSLMTWEAGHTTDLEVTVIDVMMMAYWLSGRGKSNGLQSFFRFPMKLYFAAIVFSMFIAYIKYIALFDIVQALRVYLVFRVIERAVSDERVVPAIFTGLAIGIFGEFFLVIYQKFIGHVLQPPGTFPHQNALGMVANLVILPLVALMLARQSTNLRSLAVLAGLGISALIASRGTLGLAAVGLVLTWLCSSYVQSTQHKYKFLGVGLVLAVIMTPVAIASLSSRFDYESKTLDMASDGTAYDERDAYKLAASMMLDDNPLGVGANNFLVQANVGGYYERAGVIAVGTSRSGHVHNLYWLTLAELGYFGGVALFALLGTILVRSLRMMLRHRGDVHAELLAGLFVSVLMFAIHCNFEWIAINPIVQYVLATVLGVTAGTMQILWSKQADPKRILPQPYGVAPTAR